LIRATREDPAMSIPSTPSFLPTAAASSEIGCSAEQPPLSKKISAALTRWARHRADRPEAALDEFADLVAETYRSETVDRVLLLLARRVAGPGLKSVVVLRTGHEAHLAKPDAPRNEPFVDYPMKFGGTSFGILRLEFDRPHHFNPERHRRLATLAVLAAAAEKSKSRCHVHEIPLIAAEDLESRTDEHPHPTHDLSTGLPNSFFLTSFLSYALALSERRREPLSLLYIGIDRLAAIRNLHGVEYADDAVRRVAKVVAGSLRTSDLIARLDDGRLVAVLPGANRDNSLLVAESLRTAVSTNCGATMDVPLLTASIGVASFPDDADDAVGLRSAAAAALADARSYGHNRVVAAGEAQYTSSDETTTIRVATCGSSA
jgi:diguanylate cyclase (GGDEF)-like protein